MKMNILFPKSQIDFESSSWSQHALDTAGLTLAHGTPVCRGRYKGVAKVVTKLADAAAIKQVHHPPMHF